MITMALYPDYITEAQFRSYVNSGNILSGTAGTAEIAFAISAASRAIDSYTGRQFGLAGSAVARYYSAFGQGNDEVIVIDDLMTTTGLEVSINSEPGGSYDTLLTLNTDYYFEPLNALADNKPYTRIMTRDASFPLWTAGVEVVAKWGWSEVPALVEQACLIQASRFYNRRNSPYGIAGSLEQGSELRLLSRLDPDVQLLLQPLVRPWGVL